MVLVPIFTLEIIKDLFYIYHIINIYYTDYYLRFSRPQYGELANSITILFVLIVISFHCIYFHKEMNSAFFLLLIVWILITNGYVNVIKKAEFDFLGFIKISNTITTADDNKSSDDSDNKGLINLLVDNSIISR
jgi:hypothetical protein